MTATQNSCWEVLAISFWEVHHGGGSNSLGGIQGQLTKLSVQGVTCYVRENIRYDSFGTGSSGRMAMKHGRLPKDSQQVLELAAPKHYWDEIAAIVQQIEDSQCGSAGDKPRPIIKNHRFTLRWAEVQFSGGVSC